MARGAVAHPKTTDRGPALTIINDERGSLKSQQIAERHACEIRLRAERKADELLREREKAKGAIQPGTNSGTTRSDDPIASPTLRDLGISKQQ